MGTGTSLAEKADGFQKALAADKIEQLDFNVKEITEPLNALVKGNKDDDLNKTLLAFSGVFAKLKVRIYFVSCIYI